MLFLSHGERGARVDSGWGGQGRTAQCPPLRATNSEGKEEKDKRGEKGRWEEKNKEKRLASALLTL